MLQRSLRIKVMVAMFSAAFFVGTCPADAYTYSGNIATIDSLDKDENEVVISNGAKLIVKSDAIPLIERKTIKNNVDVTTQSLTVDLQGGQFLHGYLDIAGLPLECNKELILDIQKNYITAAKTFNKNKSKIRLENIYTKYGYNIELSTDIVWHNVGAGTGGGDPDALARALYFYYDLKYEDNKWSYDFDKTNDELVSSVPENKKTYYGSRNIYSSTSTSKLNIINSKVEDSSLTINDSKLISEGNVKTTKSIIVKGNSTLKANGTIIGGDIYSDKAIISTTNDQGESIITPGNITATGALKSDTYIGAVSGAVSGNTVYSGGDIVSDNFIKAGGLAKGNALNVAAINATTASITGNQSISGIFTTTGQAKLNGGAALGGKKITGLSIGTLSTTSTDAVNGKQLYTAMQSSGKTYTAGSDISISSANAISVAKAGKVVSGNTGIMTGDAVYQETSKIDSTFKSHNASITSNNSKLDNLTTSIESLRKSLGTINSSVSDAISGLPGSLANFANKDLTDLSDTGINTLKSYIKSEIKKQMPSNSKTASYAMGVASAKDTSAIDNVIASKANTSDLTALGSKVESKADKADVSLMEDTINAKADLSYVNDGLAKKADQSVVEAIGRDVDSNTSAIAKNTELIQSNTEAVSGLKDSKADVSGSNINVSSWNTKLGNGTIAKDDTGLVTGNSAASALDKKADIGYVTIGLGAMESSLGQINQSVTKDVSRVGAGASALMGLHPTGDKFEFATAYGHYKNSNNTALGVFYKPSANSTVSVAGTIGDGDAMLSAGVSIKLGLNKEVKKVITPNEFSTMKAAVDSQDEKLNQMEKTLQQLMVR